MVAISKMTAEFDKLFNVLCLFQKVNYIKLYAINISQPNRYIISNFYDLNCFVFVIININQLTEERTSEDAFVADIDILPSTTVTIAALVSAITSGWQPF